jgi:hypothetical protein
LLEELNLPKRFVFVNSLLYNYYYMRFDLAFSHRKITIINSKSTYDIKRGLFNTALRMPELILRILIMHYE